MSVQYLSDANFTIAGNKMLCNVPNLAFVLFKTENCAHCQQVTPIFHDLAQREMRVTWAIADVGRFRNIISMAKQSTTPLRAVPMFVLYVNGRPHANYKGKRTPDNLHAFLSKILATIKQTDNTSFSRPQAGSQQQQNVQIPQTYQPINTGGQQQQQMDLTGGEVNIPNRVTPYNEPWRRK